MAFCSWAVSPLAYPQRGAHQEVLIISVPECPGPVPHFSLGTEEAESLCTVHLKSSISWDVVKFKENVLV